jgi:RHS repeat-associated protein
MKISDQEAKYRCQETWVRRCFGILVWMWAMAGVTAIGHASVLETSVQVPGAAIGVAPYMPTPTEALAQWRDPAAGQEFIDPMVAELAIALDRNPTRILAYVRDEVAVTPVFGLHKGSYGTLIDHSGSPLDQVQLLVHLFRAAGFTAEYQLGIATLNRQTTAEWLGSDRTGVVRQILANGGFAATVQADGETVRTVELAHVIAAVTIDGRRVLVDPAFKSYEPIIGSPLTTVMQMNPATLLSEAQIGQQGGGTQFRQMNAQRLQDQLQAYALRLENHISSARPDSRLIDITGGRQIVRTGDPFASSYALPALPYPFQSLQTPWASAIPKALRIQLTLRITFNQPGSSTFQRQYFADDVYGREFLIRNLAPLSYSSPTHGSALYKPKLLVSVRDRDSVEWEDTEGPLLYAPIYNVAIDINMPYPAGAGTYMDRQIQRSQIPLMTPAALIVGVGETSDQLKVALERARSSSSGLEQTAQPGTCTLENPPHPIWGFTTGSFEIGGGNCTESELTQPWLDLGEKAKTGLAAGWLALHHRAAELTARLAGGIHQPHGVFGIVSSPFGLNQYAAQHDALLVIDAEPGLSVVALDGTEAKRRAILHTIASASSTLEAQALYELNPQPEIASATNRLAWANRPPAAIEPTQPTRAPETFYWVDSQNADTLPPATRSALQPVLQQGFKILAVSATDLGPGRSERTFRTLQRRLCCWVTSIGGALIAVREDRISYLTFSGGEIQSDTLLQKGGSGVNVGPTIGKLDPSEASVDFIRQQAEKNRLVTRVDLQTGTLNHEPAPDLIVGSGDFPYQLSFQRYFRRGQAGSPGLAAGWSHNLDIRLDYGSSGLEAFGLSRPLHGAPGLAYLATLLSLFEGGIDGERLLAGAIAGQWLLDRMTTNIAIIQSGNGDSSTFVRGSNGAFHPTADGEQLLQENERFLSRKSNGDLLETYWRYRYETIRFTRVLRDGSRQLFHWYEACRPGVPAGCSTDWPDGFYIQSWTFPSGMAVDWTYGAATKGLASVQNNLGRGLYFDLSPQAAEQVFSIIRDRPSNQTGRAVALTMAPLSDGSSDDLALGFRQSRPLRTLVSVSNPLNETVSYRYTAAPGSGASIDDVHYGPSLLAIIRPSETQPAIQFSYGPRRTLRSETTKAGVTRHYASGPRQGLRRAGDGGVVSETFDNERRNTATLDAVGSRTSQRYDVHGRVVEIRDAMAGLHRQRYDTRGNVIEDRRIARPDATPVLPDQVRSWRFPASCPVEAAASCNQPIAATDALGRVTDFDHHPTRGLLLSMTEPAILDAESGTQRRPVNRFEYDGYGRMTTRTHPDGRTSLYHWSPDNETMTRVVEDAGGSGRLNLTTRFEWTPVGDLSLLVDPLSREFTADYNAARRRTALAGPEGFRAVWHYDGRGWITGLDKGPTAPVGIVQQWRFGYTLDGQITTVTDPIGRTTSTLYDPVGRPDRVTSPGGRLTTTRYDRADRVVEERAAVGTTEEQAVARYTYFADGQVQGITDPRDYVLGHRYDGYGRLVRLDQADGRSEAYEYDANDNRIALVQRDGTRSVTRYDALNRPVSITRPGLAEVSYGFDIAGQLVTERMGNTLIRRHAYDSAGRKTGVTATLPRPANAPGAAPVVPVSFTYDAAGNRTSATWSGAAVEWRHDGLNRLTAVLLNGQPVTAHRYDPLGRRTETDRGRVANDPAAPANDQPLLTSRYGYDLADQLTNLAHNWVGGGLTAGYTYTANGELESESVSDPAFLWTPAPTQPRSLTYGPADPINALTTVNGIAQAHDGRGNRTRAGTRSFGYDSRNMLTAATLPGVQASYGYWPEGGRAWKSVNGTTTLYLEIDGVEWGEYDQSGNLRRRTIRASGSGGAAIATADPTNRLTWHLPNRQGSVIGWAGPDGRLQGKLTYDAYGNSPQAATPGPAYRYAGMRYDPETGLSLTPNRSYDPQDGRWLQLDPIGAKDGLNRYAYVKNGPTNGVDPSGLAVETVWDLISIGIGLDSASANYQQGNYGAVAVDVIGIVLDTAAIAVPGVPGGASAGIKAARGIEEGIDTTRGTEKAVDRIASGREPKSLMDQMVMDAAKNGEGTKIMENLNDPKFKGMDKYRYYERSKNGNLSEVHYVKNPKTGELSDFKMKHSSTEPKTVAKQTVTGSRIPRKSPP